MNLPNALFDKNDFVASRRRRKLSFMAAGILVVSSLFTHNLYGDIALFIDNADFLNTLNSPHFVQDFEFVLPGTTLASSDELDGLTFNYDFGGVALMVTDAFDAVSGTNSLGTNDFDVLQFGDEFEMQFAVPSSAIGLSIIVAAADVNAGLILDDDIRLNVGQDFVGLDVSESQGADLADGGRVYFLGIISDSPISAADISYGTSAAGFFNVDDITFTSIPEPAATALFISMTIMGIIRRSRRAGQAITIT